MKFFGLEKITKLAKTSNDVVSLPAGSYLKIGGQGYRLSTALSLNRTVSGVGGLQSAVANSTFYYVYAVLSGGIVYLLGSTSPSAPSGYSAYRKVGAFYTQATGLIFKSYYFEQKLIERYSAKYDNNGTIGGQTPFAWISAVVRNGSSNENKELTLLSTIFSTTPNYSHASITNGTDTTTSADQETATFIRITTRNNVNTPFDRGFTVEASPAGIDATQPDWT